MSSIYERLKSNEPLFGDYLLGKNIGSGSFSEVYEIYHRYKADMKCALKAIPVPKDKYEPIENSLGAGMTPERYIKDTLMRYKNEVDIQFSLKDCQNIVSIVGFTQNPHEDGSGVDIYIMSELLKCLSEIFETKSESESEEPFDHAIVTKLGIDICTALEVMHEKGIIHRDIKPANIFFSSSSGLFKLGDFGISKIADERTKNSSMMGTPRYSAPETAKYMLADHRSDIYSLGLVMYTMMNDFYIPFLGNDSKSDYDAVLARNRGDKIQPPKNANKCEELTRVVMRACEYEPSNRYQSAKQMKSDLLKIGKEPAKKPLLASLIITLVIVLAGVGILARVNYLKSPDTGDASQFDREYAQEEFNKLTDETPPLAQPPTQTFASDYDIAQNGEINFTNDELEDEIRLLCGINDRILTISDFETITELTLSEYQAIEDNFGIVEYFTELEVLDLSDTFISNLNPLSNLKSLKEINLNNTPVEDLNPIQHLSQITKLILYGTNVKSIDSILRLTDLEVLSLAFTDVSDIELISRFTALAALDIRGTTITDISVLEKLKNLKRLGIGGGPYFDDIDILRFSDNIHIIKELSNLEVLIVQSIKQFDISLIQDFRNLKILSILNTDIVNLDEISNLTNLEELELINIGIEDISFINNLTNLEYLNLGSNVFSDISSISNLKNLKTLILDENGEISDVSALETLSNLETLVLRFVGDGLDISMLNNLENLREFDLSYTDCTGYRVIENFHALEKLSIYSSSYLEDEQNLVEALSSLKNLKELRIDLSDSDVSEIKLLSNKLTNIDLRLESLANISSLTNCPQLTNVKIKSGKLHDINPLNSLLNLNELVLDFRWRSDLERSADDYIDFSAIKDLSDLKKLSIYYSPSTDTPFYKQTSIDFIDNLTNLTELSLNISNAQGFSQLQYLDKLKTLDLSGSSVNSILWIGHLKRLEVLNVSDSKVNDILSLKYLENLNDLDLSKTEVNDISDLIYLESLNSLDISRTEVNDISGLSHLENLVKLDISNTGVSDISGLSHLENLVKLDISNTDVGDISSIMNLENLEILDLSYTEVDDISGIENLKNLTNLDIQKTGISDIKPLYELNNLKYLWISESQIRQEDIQELEKRLPELHIYIW